MPKKTNPRVKLIVSLSVISVILGLMLSMQYKNTRAAAKFQLDAAHVYDPRAQYTADQLNKTKETNSQYEAQLEKLKKQMFELEEKAGDIAKQESPDLKDELSKYRVMSGILPLKGEGITFTLDDSMVKDVPKDWDPELLIVHDSDLMNVTNELLIAGAEAVQINDQRISSTTGIICIGPVIKINGQKINRPYEFRAIGNKDRLEAALTLKGGVLDIFRYRTLTIQPPKKSLSVSINGYSGNFNGLSENK
ncbi:uncharacterized protein YlxW (UPF0749 family) [Tumebacillus sp. BK434]|uniref:DUF881 domain-containing protein n=1 Tax=Tumebacillus sp. BK434 TaxID=2512169 RepID=UPI00104D1D71|nr:DUF881 domain-containing protein [Tumebacillus sp. BK434]TCP52931.1 uncharacterized protein YlxW (UPF0749 family) [Tumebacillus sp. BK434]